MIATHWPWNYFLLFSHDHGTCKWPESWKKTNVRAFSLYKIDSLPILNIVFRPTFTSFYSTPFSYNLNSIPTKVRAKSIVLTLVESITTNNRRVAKCVSEFYLFMCFLFHFVSNLRTRLAAVWPRDGGDLRDVVTLFKSAFYWPLLYWVLLKYREIILTLLHMMLFRYCFFRFPFR